MIAQIVTHRHCETSFNYKLKLCYLIYSHIKGKKSRRVKQDKSLVFELLARSELWPLLLRLIWCHARALP